MTSIRPFCAQDVFNFNTTNLDPLTETYGLDFYFSYLARWPSLFQCSLSPADAISGYIMGKVEESPDHLRFTEHYLPWHAHITALTVSPSSRRLGIAKVLSQTLENGGEASNAWFADLFVRRSNKIAQGMYKGMGYSVYRTIKEYYVDDPKKGLSAEDGFDMRKPLSRDKKREHIRENGEQYEVDPNYTF